MTKTVYEKIKFRKKLIRWLCFLGVVIGFGYLLSPFYKIGFNTTESLDGWVYLVEKTKLPQRGDVVAVYRPAGVDSTRLDFLKILAGLPGDQIEIRERKFFINGQFVGEAKEHSMTGESLEMSQSGMLAHDEYFIWTNHKDSLDSRYKKVGRVSSNTFIGRAVRIF